jgi:diguanylate cyclase (GGDEF)-like protein
MLDIDYFKAFNDTYGHLKGDDCLKTVAATLKKTLKRPGDFSARYGGEEFAVVLPNTDDVGAGIVAEELRASIERAGIAHINSLCADYVTVSLGAVTRFSEQAETPDDLILAADRALYRSKHEGRNRVSVELLM